MTKSPIRQRLMNKAIDYLGRYSSSSHKLGAVLDRFARRKLDAHDPAEITAAIADTVSRCIDLGYLDDTAFAAGQARNHRRLGRSARGIKQRLRQHRIDESAIAAALETADEDVAHGDLYAAFQLARRRRIGPFDSTLTALRNTDQAAFRQRRHRQLGVIARAGFPIDICQRVLDVHSESDADRLIAALEAGEDPFL